MHLYEVLDCTFNHDEKYIDLLTTGSSIRVPYFDINRINVFQHRIGIWYKKSNIAVVKADPHAIRKLQREIEKSKIPMRNAT